MTRKILLLCAGICLSMFIVSCEFNKSGLIANLGVMDGDTIHPGFSAIEIRIDGRECNFKDGYISCAYFWHGVTAGEVEMTFEAFGVPHSVTINLSDVDRKYTALHVDYRMHVGVHEGERLVENKFRSLGRAAPLSKYSLGNEQETVRVISGNHLRGNNNVSAIMINESLATRVELGPPQRSMWDNLAIGEHLLTYRFRDEERWARIEIIEPGGMLFIGGGGVMSYNSEWVQVLEEPDYNSVQTTLTRLNLDQAVR